MKNTLQGLCLVSGILGLTIPAWAEPPTQKKDAKELLEQLGSAFEGVDFDKLNLEDLLKTLERKGLEHYLKKNLNMDLLKRQLGAGLADLLGEAQQGLEEALSEKGVDLEELKQLLQDGSVDQLLEKLRLEDLLGNDDWQQKLGRELLPRLFQFEEGADLRRFLEELQGQVRPPVDQAEREEAAELDKELDEAMRAFQPVLAEAAKSTVWLADGDKEVAFGTIVSDDGLILSKASELAKRSVDCLLADGRRMPARVVRTFEAQDLVVLKVDAHGLTPAKWDTGSTLELGSFLSSPDPKGKPIAIGVASVAPRDLSQRSKGFLGIAPAPAKDGVRIRELVPGSAAAEAGLRMGDVILRLADKTYPTPLEFSDAVAAIKPNQPVEILFRRGDEERRVTVKLKSREGLEGRQDRATPMDRMGAELSKTRGGFPNALQHDLPLEPEQCGGPLVDLDGRVVGINIARAGRVKSYAIPSAEVVSLLKQLAEKPEGEPAASQAAAPTPDREAEINRLIQELRDAQQALDKAKNALEAVK